MSSSCQGKVTGDSVPVDQYSKMRMAGQLRGEAGPCLDKIRDYPLLLPTYLHMHRKPPWKSKGEGS